MHFDKKWRPQLLLLYQLNAEEVHHHWVAVRVRVNPITHPLLL